MLDQFLDLDTAPAPAAAAPAPMGHNKPPRRAYKGTPRKCMECGVVFRAGHPNGLFCTPKHQADFHNRHGKEGRVLIPLAQAWRAARGSKDPATKETARAAFRLVCKMLDEANANDRAAGRPGAVAYAQAKERHGWL